MRAVLTYHSIDESGSPISVGRDAFRAHVEWLAGGGVPVVALGDVVRRPPGDGDAIAITFDDGFRNTAEVAAPILREHALPYTVFVVSGHVGGTNAWNGVADAGVPVLPLMSWQSLGALAAAGAAIGAHTRSHPHLPALADAVLDDELAGSRATIEAMLGVPAAAFAYPYGEQDARVASRVRGHFAHACTTELRPLRPDDDRALLPRLDMYYFREPGQLEAWGTPAFRRRLWLRGQGRRARALARRAGFPA